MSLTPQQQCLASANLGLRNCTSIPLHDCCPPDVVLSPAELCGLAIYSKIINCTVTPRDICCVDIPDPALRDALSICITVMLAVIMLGMGCSVEIRKVFIYLKKPIGPVVGLLCQFSKYTYLCYII